jgi:exopolysaccharide production protein ExoZ
LSKKSKLLSLQVFRGMAALIVLLHHGVIIMANHEFKYLNTIFNVGWVGVDFFFVLSGFIIYYTCNTYIGRREKTKEYLIKRLIRIYPIYWLITIGVLLMYKIMNHERNFNLDQIIKSILLFPQSDIPIVSVSWTLVYEIFFYLMFGLIIYTNKKLGKIICMIWILGILLNSFKIIDMNGYFYLNFLFSNNNIEFIIGCFVAYYILNYSLKYSGILILLGLLAFIYSWINVIEGDIIRGSTESMLMFGTSCGLLVLASASIDLNSKPTIPKILLILGDASFSIYLTHIYIFGFLNQIFLKFNVINPLLAFGIMVIITVILGIFFYYFIEKPMLSFIKERLVDNRNSKKLIKRESRIIKKI